MVQTGAKAQRVYVLSVQQEFDKACGRETHILARKRRTACRG